MQCTGAALAALVALAGCSSTPSTASSAFSLPIDFAWACEGAGQTVAPENDETASSINDTRMCPDVGQTEVGGATTTAQGELYGVVLNRQPPGLVVVQMNPAAGKRDVLDTDAFVPGHTPIPVGRDPIRVLTATDYSAFYVVSAGDREVDRVVITGRLVDLTYTVDSFALPGEPADAVMSGDTLVVAAADASELWLYDLGADPVAPPMAIVALPGRVQDLVAWGDELVVTWIDRPVVTRLGLDGVVLGEGGLAPECRDGLDNDGDGAVDAADADCGDADDDDESDATGAPRDDTVPDAAPGFAGAALCDNGVDDDGDGFTDFPDAPGCASADDDAEGLPACSNGVDDDGDGLTDFDGAGDPALADPSCYGPYVKVERRLPVDGPFHPVVIDGGDAGAFVYVLDERKNEVVVYSPRADGGLDRVDVNGATPVIPDLVAVPYASPSDEATATAALPATRPPAYARQRRRNIVLESSPATAITASRLRGELWERIIAPETTGAAPSVPFGLSSVRWTPAWCAEGGTDACAQPDNDDATWYAFAPRLDGRIAQIEVIRRGVPVHRVAERKSNPADRGLTVTGPRLTLRGTFVAARGEPQAGYAFIGAGIEEQLAEAVDDESSARIRRYGVWPPADLEEAPSESWTLTYEGRIPGTYGALGRMTSDTTLVDSAAAFCEAGVAVGDWAAFILPVASADPALHATVDIVTELGETCPVLPLDQLIVEARVTRVGMTELEVDPATARLRPRLATLDEDAISAQKLSLRACKAARELLDERIGLPDHLVATDAFAAAALPPRFSYSVRVGDAWAMVGTVSGFLHRQRWDRAAGECVVDETLDPRLTGRHAEAAVSVDRYQSCPPPADQLRFDTIEQLTPADARFENPSFAVDILPGCERLEDGSIALVPSQQDTTWSFTLTGPHEASTLAVSNSDLGVRAGVFDLRRQVMQLDAAARRASLLQVRPDNPTIIDIFE
ncbi:MAG: hypothetical protein CVU56_10010 [Deltaproteobacteria bacterium HGW-Deltaproteobacteria-14]|nr:MAG: hypothetical protein CVU56_10010 [Deltaproteobacteria bacterium HGW-Deltaproteobacteria-14]